MATALLPRVVASMQKFAPLTLAETSWDNVGVLLENPKPKESSNVLLTIDFTEKVLEEAIKKNISVVVSYHPPIFSSWKRLTLADPKQTIIMKSILAGISIYSPHTSLDACKNGINDWLANGISHSDYETLVPIKPTPAALGFEGTGMGRIVTFKQSISFEELVQRTKKLLNLSHVRIAKASDQIKSVAICAGSGGGLLNGVVADAYLTGEMSHHEVLGANSKQVSVILCEHTNTERGYLEHSLKPYLSESLGSDVSLFCSEEDKDPLTVA